MHYKLPRIPTSSAFPSLDADAIFIDTGFLKNYCWLVLCNETLMPIFKATHEWLVVYKPHTYQSYRKEAERLLLWSLFNMQKPLLSMTTADLALFRDFLFNQQPASIWVAKSKYPRTHENGAPL